MSAGALAYSKQVFGLFFRHIAAIRSRARATARGDRQIERGERSRRAARHEPVVTRPFAVSEFDVVAREAPSYSAEFNASAKSKSSMLVFNFHAKGIAAGAQESPKNIDYLAFGVLDVVVRQQWRERCYSAAAATQRRR